jgi:hypothetical protein
LVLGFEMAFRRSLSRMAGAGGKHFHSLSSDLHNALYSLYFTEWHPRMGAKQNKYLTGLVTFREIADPTRKWGKLEMAVVSVPFLLLGYLYMYPRGHQVISPTSPRDLIEVLCCFFQWHGNIDHPYYKLRRSLFGCCSKGCGCSKCSSKGTTNEKAADNANH